MGFFESISAYKANLAFSKRNFDKAVNIYKKLTSKDGVNPAIIIKYAYVSVYLGDLDNCKKQLDKVNVDGLNNDILISSYKQTQALYIWKKGDINKAIEIFKDLHNQYRNTSIYETLGYLLVINNSLTEALEYNLEAYDYAKDNNVIIDNLAETYYFLKQYGKAKELYLKIIDPSNTNKPKFSEAYYYYGKILLREGKKEEAKKQFEIALTMRESFLSELKHKDIKEAIDNI